MYLKISASHEFFNPKEGLKTLLFDPPRLAPHQGCAEILGDPYAKKSPLPCIGTIPHLPVFPDIPSH
jgi:hypothetical protein